MKEKKYSNQLEFIFDRPSNTTNKDQNFHEENVISFNSAKNKHRIKKDSELVNYVLRNTRSF